MGYLEPEKLVWGVIEQAKETIFSLFTWSDGEYKFDEGDLPTQEMITLNLSTQEVIFGGLGRIERWDWVLAGLGNLDTAYQVSPVRDRILKRLKLDEAQSALLSALEQPMSARAVCRMDLLPDFQACRTLWAFKILGLVEPAAGADRMLRQLAMQDEESAASLSLCAAPGATARSAGGRTQAAQAPAASTAVLEPPPDEAPGEAAEASAAEEAAEDDSSFTSVEASAWTPDPNDPSTFPSIPAAPKAASPGDGGSAPADYAELDPAVEPEAPAAPSPSAPPPAEPSAPAWDPDEAEIAAFNDRQRRLFSLMSEKVGQQATDLVRRTLQSLGKELPGIFKGVQAGDDGGIDSKGIKANVAASGAKNLSFALDLVIERELEAVAGMLGPAVRREIAGKLKGA
jgi:hypothetical protein